MKSLYMGNVPNNDASRVQEGTLTMTIEILAGPLFTDFSTESNPPAIHSTPFVLLRFLHSTPFVLHTFELPRRGTLRVGN
jgi:hypothetical protein